MDSLGKGSFGFVETDGEYAYKIPSGDNFETAKVYLKREADALNHLKHKHIVQMVRFEINPYRLVLEMLDGGDLVDAIIAESIIDQKKVVRQIAEVLSYFKRQGFVHGDFRAENVRLLSSGDIKVFDFGTAGSEGTAICWNEVYGCKSPERILGLPRDAATDVWGLGGIMVMMQCRVNFLPDVEIPADFDVPKTDRNHYLRGALLSQIVIRTRCFFTEPLKTHFYEKASHGAQTCHSKIWKYAEMHRGSVGVLNDPFAGPTKHLLKKILKLNPRDRITADLILMDSYLSK